MKNADDPTEIELDEIAPNASIRDSAEFLKAFEELKTRCDAAAITCEYTSEDRRYCRILLPAGRDKRSIYLWDAVDIRRILSFPFERYTFLGDYLALCSYSKGRIVALVNSNSRLSFKRGVLGLREFERSGLTGKSLIIQSGTDKDGPRITIGYFKDTALQLVRRRFDSGRELALKLENVNISQHDEALSLLERLSNSLFFQIDLAFNVTLTISRSRRAISRPRRPVLEKIGIQFPKNEYD